METSPEVDTALYITAANEGDLLAGTLRLAGVLQGQAPKTLRWKFRHMPDEDHGSTPHRTTYDGSEFIFEQWMLRDPIVLFDAGGWEAVAKHYADERGRFGCADHRSLRDMIGMAMKLRELDRFDDMLTLFETVDVEAYSVPSMYFNFVAGDLAEEKHTKGAEACYRMALKLEPHDETARDGLIALGVEPPAAPEPLAVPADVLAQYVGRYHFAAQSMDMAIHEQEGALYVEMRGERKKMFAKSNTEFTEFGATFTFKKIDGEWVLVLSAGGQEFTCKRLAG